MFKNNQDNFLERADDQYNGAAKATEKSARDAHLRRAHYYRATAEERLTLLTSERPRRPILTIR